MSDLSRIAAASLLLATVALVPMAASAESQRFIPDIIISSTIPANGDVNPYGVAFVPSNFPKGGAIAPGDILVSNFNNSGNTQGTGTTIIKLTPNGSIAPAGSASTFFTSTPIGLTTALGVLQGGFVLVGNVPTSGGVIQAGSLQIVDRSGNHVASFTNQLNDPWDLTIYEQSNNSTVFVSNVNGDAKKNKNGSVTRLNLIISSAGISVTGTTVIARGYTVEPNAAALVLGPTGLAYDATTDTLFVASTADNAIFAVPNAGNRTGSAGTGNVIFKDDHLRGPLALAFAPNGDLITSNGDAVNPDPTQPSEIVEFTKSGEFVGQFNVDAGQGGAFGIAIALIGGDTARLAAVDDNTNSLIVIDQKVVPGG